MTGRRPAGRPTPDAQALLVEVISNLPATLSVTDRAGVILLSEGGALRQYGQRPGETVGQSVLELYASRPDILELYRRAYAGEVVETSAEVRGRIFDGSLRPMRDAGGEIVGAISIGFDTTERVLAERAIRASEAQLATAQRIARLGRWEWDVATGEVAASDQLYGLYGIAVTPDSPRVALADLVDPDDLPRVRSEMGQAIREGRLLSVDFRGIHADGGTRHMRLEGEPRRDASGRVAGLVGTVQDVTEQTAAMDRLPGELGARHRHRPALLVGRDLPDLRLRAAIVRAHGRSLQVRDSSRVP